jgi:hypothetical protein
LRAFGGAFSVGWNDYAFGSNGTSRWLRLGVSIALICRRIPPGLELVYRQVFAGRFVHFIHSKNRFLAEHCEISARVAFGA